MKPIIVTYSNESWIMMAVGWLSMMQSDGWPKELPNTGYYICESIPDRKSKNIADKDIKLIARPKK